MQRIIGLLVGVGIGWELVWPINWLLHVPKYVEHNILGLYITEYNAIQQEIKMESGGFACKNNTYIPTSPATYWLINEATRRAVIMDNTY